MSFASDVKNELCRVPLGRHRCAVAEAYGVLLYCHTFTTREIRIVTACDALAERLPKLFRRAFGAHFALPAAEKTGGRHVLTITDRAAIETVFAAFGADLSRTVAHHINLAVLENDCCKASFLRGAFLAGGSVTDPSKNYHLELITAHASVNRYAAYRCSPFLSSNVLKKKIYMPRKEKANSAPNNRSEGTYPAKKAPFSKRAAHSAMSPHLKALFSLKKLCAPRQTIRRKRKAAKTSAPNTPNMT